MSRTKSDTLWGVLCPSPHHGYPHPLRMTNGSIVLPLFSAPYKAEAWVMGLRLDPRHFLTKPLCGKMLVAYAELAAGEWGFTDWTLNPPTLISLGVEHQDIAGLIEQAEAKVR